MKDLRTNNQIRTHEVKVIGANGEQLGVMAVFKALELAKQQGLDLVEVGPNVVPPIVKVMDYGKYKYQKTRQEKKTGVKPKAEELKTVRVGFKTGAHDLAFKAKQIGEFLNKGHMVKIELTLRGREKALAQLGREKLNGFMLTIAEPHITRESIKRSPFGWITIIQKAKTK